MTEVDSKKLDQIIVMLADMHTTLEDRFDKLADGQVKHDRRLDTIADRLLAIEKKLSALERRLERPAMRSTDQSKY